MFHPVFVLAIILCVIVLWFLLSFAYKPVGRFVLKLWNDSVSEIKDNEEKKEGKNFER